MGYVIACPTPAPDILTGVELFFTALLVIVGLAIAWFSGYVIYRLYSDQR